MKKISILVASAAILLLAGTAFAGTIVQLKEIGTVPATAVTVHINPQSGPGIAYNGGAYAGFYVVEIQNWGQYAGFCVDPAFSNNAYSAYELHPVSGLNSAYAGAAYLLNKYQSYYGDSTKNNEATKIQLAIWDLVMNTLSGAGSFSAEGWDYSFYLAEAQANLNFNAGGYYVAGSPIGGSYYGYYAQDYIIHVPEPGLIILLGLGIMGASVLGFSNRKS